jgi:hypothetical protein
MRQNVTYVFKHPNDNTILKNLIWDPVAQTAYNWTILVLFDSPTSIILLAKK